MREVIPYVRKHDPYPPDVRPGLIADGLIRNEVGEPYNKPPNKGEQLYIEQKLTSYYNKNWPTIIMRILKFRAPLVANGQSLTSESIKVDPSNPIYFHVDWLRPGKHVYLVEHDNEPVASDGEEGQDEKKFNAFLKSKIVKGKVSQQHLSLIHI